MSRLVRDTQAMSEYAPLPLPIIDPRNESDLINAAIALADQLSNGLLNDFSLNSPMLALIESQAFVAGELLYYLNRSIAAIAIQYYKNFGIEQKLGSPAIVELKFTLNAVQSNLFSIPSGFIVTTSSGKIAFKTSRVLTIEPGNLTGNVDAISIDVGTVQNVTANSLNQISQPLSNLKSVTNPLKANGGLDAETFDQTIERANVLLRSRGLVSRDDYVNMAKSIVGQDCLFKAVSNLGADKSTFVLGSVHLFGLNSDRNPLSVPQINNLNNLMLEKIHISSSLYISSFSFFNLAIDVVVIAELDEECLVIANNIKFNLDVLFFNFEEGVFNYYETVYLIRDVINVNKIISLLINNEDVNIAMPNIYTLPKMNRLNIRVLSKYNNSLLLEQNYNP